MKFTKGAWLWEEDINAVLPSQVYDVDVEEKALTVYVPVRTPGARNTLLATPVMAVRFSSPLPGVIRVSASHFYGALAKEPHFALRDERPDVRIVDTAEYAELTSGNLSVRVRKDGLFSTEFTSDGRVLTGSSFLGMAHLSHRDGSVYMREQLNLGVGECVYGLGEHFTAFVKNGQRIDMWNEDAGTCSDLAYKNVPFYLTNNGYGVFVNSPGPVSFEVGTERVSRVQFSHPGETLEYYVISGPTPKHVLTKFTDLTGRPALPPAWTFGLWLTTSFTTNYDEETVTSFIQGMADRDIPLHVFHFDCFWMKPFHWCDFTWDESVFPDPAAMLRRLKERGLRICVWINPYIAQRSPLFAEGMANGYLLKKPNGDIWQTDNWQPGRAFVDFTNPAAVRWYGDYLRALVRMGVDSFKTDFGERIATDVVYHDGSDPMRMHNYYAYLYNKTVFDVLKEELGEGNAAVFARSATAGCQQFPIHWGGDCSATFESMAESLRGGLSLCASGFGFWSHDISGFEQTATPTLYKRWVAFGLLSSHSRLHGNSSYRVPWNFDEESVEVLRYFTKLKCRVMPYLFQAACEAATDGIPMMRAMVLEYPDDPACTHLDRQYFLGPSLLVAPVFADQGPVDYYLPDGRWTDFFTGAVREGGRWVREDAPDFFRIPLWVRENTVLPLGTNEEKPDYDYADGITLHCYQLLDGAEITVRIPDTTGATAARFRVTRTGSTVRATRESGTAPWRVTISNSDAQAAAGAETDELVLTI